MLLVKERDLLGKCLLDERRKGKITGCVPTMGALHEGHVSLLRVAREQADVGICSIFVNPTQFNDRKDFEHYPVTIGEDIFKASRAGTDFLFLPALNEIYPGGTGNLPHYDFGYLETILEGAYRPGHFQGVGQVMQRLLKIVQPHRLFMGQKDYQQCMIVKRLITLLGLKTEVIICPTTREADGLAMSSRNRRLTPEQRQKAPVIHECLQYIRIHLEEKSFPALKEQAIRQLEKAGFRVDYVAIARAKDLHLLESATDEPMIALIAATTGEIRLIDNLLLD